MNLDALTESEQAALARDLADRNGPVAVSICLLEYAADLFRQSGKGKTADGCLRITQELREKIDLPRPSIVGIDRMIGSAPETKAEDRGRDLQAAVERAALRVVEKEMKPGGLIHRHVQQQLEARP